MAPTDMDVYIKRFSELKRGGPLYQPCEVQVGDVGFIDPHDGFFQKLYNIADPPTNRKPGCPPRVKFKTTSRTEQWDAIHLKKSKGSGGSSQVTVPKGQMQIVFSEVKHGECILIPGNIVVMERIEETRNLPKYMTENLDWIGSTFAGDEGYQFSPESLILVHRTVKTDRWAIAVNTSSEVVRNLSFNIGSTVGATVWGQWSASSLISRRGPVPDTGTLHPTGIEGANQTIFVRRIARRPPTSYFGGPCFLESVEPTALERFRATVANIEQDWWVG
jgi:hypothetical protein